MPPGRGGNFTFPVDIDGDIVWNNSAGSLDAHCRHHPSCRMNRTVRPGTRAHGLQGRPVGILLRWLEVGSEFATKAEHQRSNKDIFKMTPPHRQRRRAWAELVNFPALAFERPRGPGEDPEPLGLC